MDSGFFAQCILIDRVFPGADRYAGHITYAAIFTICDILNIKFMLFIIH